MLFLRDRRAALPRLRRDEGPAGGEYVNPAIVTTSNSGIASTFFYSGQIPSDFENVIIKAMVGEIVSNTIDLTIAGTPKTVVIGYQTVKRRDLTGATAIIDPAKSGKNLVNSLAESLQGLSAGVTIRNGGAPGQNSVIEIRGTSSFVNASPLYVIDGMIADANQTINSNDIESIQIL